MKELRTVYLALLQEPEIRHGTVHILTDSMTTVHCINKQGTVRSSGLLQESEILLEEAHRRELALQASYLEGTQNTWADALSRGSTNSIDWSLTPEQFAKLCKWAGTPEIDLFAAQENHQLPLFLTRTQETMAGGPDAFAEDWKRWSSSTSFLLPTPR